MDSLNAGEEGTWAGIQEDEGERKLSSEEEEAAPNLTVYHEIREQRHTVHGKFDWGTEAHSAQVWGEWGTEDGLGYESVATCEQHSPGAEAKWKSRQD